MNTRSLMTSSAIPSKALSGCANDSLPGFGARKSLRIEELDRCRGETPWRGATLVVATLIIAIVGTSAAFAEDRAGLDCAIRFQLSDWSAIYGRQDGTPIVSHHQLPARAS